MRAGNRHRLRAAPDFHAYTGSPQCRLLTLYYYKALPVDLQERKSRKCFKKTDEKLKPLHKTKNKRKKPHDALFFKAEKNAFCTDAASGSKKAAAQQFVQQPEGQIISAAFRRRRRHLPDTRRRRFRSCRHRKAQPAGDRWGTWPARAGRALQPPHPHGSHRTH